MTDLLFLCAASFAAGALNAVAGGGTFLTFPALVYAGIPPIAANATATLTALPGYLGSAWAFRKDIGEEGRLPLRIILAIATFGGVAGSLLLLATTDSVFSGIVPWLLLIATVLFAAGPSISAAMKARNLPAAGALVSAVVLSVVAIYGGYFNGGLGIIVLAALGLLGYSNIHNMNGLKNLLAAVLSVTSAATFTIAGLIEWSAALPMAVTVALGGYAGAWLSRRISNVLYVRIFVVLVGATMTVLFFVRQ